MGRVSSSMTSTTHSFVYFHLFCSLFVGGGTSSRPQESLLDLCSRLTPSSALETIGDTRDQIEFGLLQAKSLKPCTTYLSLLRNAFTMAYSVAIGFGATSHDTQGLRLALCSEIAPGNRSEDHMGCWDETRVCRQMPYTLCIPFFNQMSSFS